MVGGTGCRTVSALFEHSIYLKNYGSPVNAALDQERRLNYAIRGFLVTEVQLVRLLFTVVTNSLMFFPKHRTQIR
jgi:hypothetical protein